MHTINHTMENSEKRDRAMRRVQEEKSFYNHLGTYIFVLLGRLLPMLIRSLGQSKRFRTPQKLMPCFLIFN